MPARSGTDGRTRPVPGRSDHRPRSPATSKLGSCSSDTRGCPHAHVPAHAAAAVGSVWESREYRALWAASGWSVVGDQLARVALTVLLFQATGSASAAAWGGAVTFLAPVVGGLLLSGAGDRWPRRQVMVTCDLVSAVLIAAMAMPGLALPVMVVLLGAASMLYAAVHRRPDGADPRRVPR